MALFVAASLVAVGFLYYQNQQLKSMLADYQTQATPIPTATTDPTVNWETYTNSKYGFSFKHPSGYSITTVEPAQFREFGVNLTLPDKSLPNTTTRLSVQVIGNKKVTYQEMAQAFHNGGPAFMNDPQSLSAISQATIGPGPALTISQTLCPPVGQNCEKTDYYFLDSNSFNFLLSETYPVDEERGNPIYKESVDEILSTFKFLETGTTPSGSPTACTMEAKLCPDGSSVGRTGPNCEFAACP